jgi:hypothetical protein
MWGHPEFGVLLIYKKWRGHYKETLVPKAISSPEGTRAELHEMQLPAGLFIPFEKGWLAAKEFVETDGKLPKSIDWIENEKLPPGMFPPP